MVTTPRTGSNLPTGTGRSTTTVSVLSQDYEEDDANDDDDDHQLVVLPRQCGF